MNDSGTPQSPAQRYLKELRARAQGQAVTAPDGSTSSKAPSDEYTAFNVEKPQAKKPRGPEVGSDVWANDVANRAAAVVELTSNWNTRGRVESTTDKDEAYEKFLKQEREELEARERANSKPNQIENPVDVAPVVPQPPPKLGKMRIQGLAGPNVNVSPRSPRLAEETSTTAVGTSLGKTEPLLPSVDC